MNRHLYRTLMVAGAALVCAGPAAAQYPSTFNSGGGYIGGYAGPNYGAPASPPLSPYLNLFQGGNPAVNYFNFVRPGLQAQQQYQQQQAGGGFPLTEPYGLASGDVLYAPPGLDPTARYPSPSGHAAAFGNLGGYYNSFGTIGAPVARGGQPAYRPPPATPRR
jgi:hypothetical protein